MLLHVAAEIEHGRYEDACAVCVTRYDGYVYQRLGDGIVAIFGYPLTYEGEAERAIHAGLEIIDTRAGMHIPEVGRLRVRIGIGTGIVVIASGEQNLVGETLNIAARLQSCTEPGPILVSKNVRDLRLKGWMLMRHGKLDAAERVLQRAIATAREQKARSWELRSAMTLAQLMAKRGERPAAHALLSGVYGWFTEGFGTRDLVAARALLDNLEGGADRP